MKIFFRNSLLLKALSLIIAFSSFPALIPASDKAPAQSEIYLFGTKDAYTDSQWYLDNDGSYVYKLGSITRNIDSTEGIDMNISSAWELYNTETAHLREVVVAVIDTGVDINHPELKDSIWVNEGEIPGDGIDNDNNGYIDDINGWNFYDNDNVLCHYAEDGTSDPDNDDDHGTHVAGIIAAKRDNKIGIAGVASNINVKIMPIKIHGGSNGDGSISDAVEAIKYACMMGADICNLSWGTKIDNEELYEVMKESDMLFVSAAGNDGINVNSSPMYPACYQLPNNISVTAIDPDGYISGNYGSMIDIGAPGTHILSTIVGDGYKSYSGSSMAAPMVSSIAAMIYAAQYRAYPSDVKEIILQTLKYNENLENYCYYSGIPDAEAIVNAILNSSIAQPVPSSDKRIPSLTYDISYNKSYIIVDLKIKESGGSGFRVLKFKKGICSAESFNHGTTGMKATLIDADANTYRIKLLAAGNYTFYISDYAGNERAVVVVVLDDTVKPTIKSSYTVSYSKNSFKFSLTLNDLAREDDDKIAGSGIKVLKYASGTHSISYFTSSKGTVLKNDWVTASFTVKKEGTYTIYACDYRGNKRIIYVYAKVVPSTAITLKKTKVTLTVGKTFRLSPTLTPKNSTDKVKYVTSDSDVATVNSAGKITAKATGKAVITATTASGISRKCTVIVTD